MDEKIVAIEMYKKINSKIEEIKVPYCKVAKDLKMSHQNFSDQMKNLKDGKFIKLKTLLNLQEYLQIKLIEINIESQ